MAEIQNKIVAEVLGDIAERELGRPVKFYDHRMILGGDVAYVGKVDNLVIRVWINDIRLHGIHTAFAKAVEAATEPQATGSKP